MKRLRIRVPGMPANSSDELLYLSADAEPDARARAAAAQHLKRVAALSDGRHGSNLQGGAVGNSVGRGQTGPEGP